MMTTPNTDTSAMRATVKGSRLSGGGGGMQVHVLPQRIPIWMAQHEPPSLLDCKAEGAEPEERPMPGGEGRGLQRQGGGGGDGGGGGGGGGDGGGGDGGGGESSTMPPSAWHCPGGPPLLVISTSRHACDPGRKSHSGMFATWQQLEDWP